MFARKKRRPVRLIVAVPPKAFFGGNDRLNADVLIDSLREIYPNLFTFDVGALYSNDRDRIDSLLEAAKDFRPEIGLALPNASYGLMLKPPLRDANSPRPTVLERAEAWWRNEAEPENIFADILRVPTILLWDHIITQPSYLILGDLPVARKLGQFGAIERLRHALSNPRLRHFVPDTGHIDVVSDMNILPRDRLRPYVVPAHKAFVTEGPLPVPSKSQAILFAGNLYASATADFDDNDRLTVEELAQEISRNKCRDWTAAGWQLLRTATRSREADVPELSPDNTFYWTVANKLIAGHLTTAFRQEVLSSARLPIDYYGGFVDAEHSKRYPPGGHIVHRGSVPLAELPRLFGEYSITLDVTHCPFIRGSNAKTLDCFAAGGCMIVDWREDLAQEVGDVANAFMYRNRDELSQRCDAMLSNERFRREVVSEMRDIISSRLTFNHLLHEVVESTLAS